MHNSYFRCELIYHYSPNQIVLRSADRTEKDLDIIYSKLKVFSSFIYLFATYLQVSSERFNDQLVSVPFKKKREVVMLSGRLYRKIYQHCNISAMHYLVAYPII